VRKEGESRDIDQQQQLLLLKERDSRGEGGNRRVLRGRRGRKEKEVRPPFCKDQFRPRREKKKGERKEEEKEERKGEGEGKRIAFPFNRK